MGAKAEGERPFDGLGFASLVRVVDFQTGRIEAGQLTARVDVPWFVVNVWLRRKGGLLRGQVFFREDGSQVVPRNRGQRFRVIGGCVFSP